MTSEYSEPEQGKVGEVTARIGCPTGLRTHDDNIDSLLGQPDAQLPSRHLMN